MIWLQMPKRNSNSLFERTAETLEPHRDYGSELDNHADFVEAARRYKLAADQGHLRALIALSDLYDKGTGVAKNHQESMRLLALAAAQKQLNEELPPMAKFRLSHMYSNGWQVKIDQIEALRLMKLAAEENSPYAMYLLATVVRYRVLSLEGEKRCLPQLSAACCCHLVQRVTT